MGAFRGNRHAGLTASVALCLFLFLPASSPADCLINQSPKTSLDTLTTLFPNWQDALVGEFTLSVCTNDDCPLTPTCNMVGLTIFNYGSAVGTDITQVYVVFLCAAKTAGTFTLNYDGLYTAADGAHAAWTWAGDYAWGNDPMYACASAPTLSVYADIGPCPVNGSTVVMGLAYNDLISAATPGGLMDACGCQVPNYDQPRSAKPKEIRYAIKRTNLSTVAPGDTVEYTVFYGRPGAAVANYVITDTLPADTHYVLGSAFPAPDPGWDPDPGPPARLQWTMPGGSSAGGGTFELRFNATVDWGNGEAFEPGSGETAAREGSRLDNVSSVSFEGSGCSPAAAHLTPPVGAIVKRYLMWKVADQDLLYAPRIGYPDDEIIYSIFIRNESTTRTWWQVRIWDTVPAELDVWGFSLGLDDQCFGVWTMTPSGGCAPGNPGWITGGGKTLLTWTLDLEPGQTHELRWKARVRSAGVVPGNTAISKVSVMALGDPHKVNGTGHARAPRTFIHIAPIALRTTYFSYVGQSANSNGCGDLPSGGLKINFYPLNRATNFELRKLHYEGGGTFAAIGGKSASITAMQGTCSGGYIDGGYGGCGAERAPSQYFWPPPCPAQPNATLFKLTSNAPVLWILMPEIGAGGDAFTYLPSTSLHHSGFTHYSYRRCLRGAVDCDPTAGYGESWVVFNTGLNENNVYDPAMPTTTHIFRWDAFNLNWVYVRGSDIDPVSLWMPFAGCTANDQETHYRIISSDERLLVYQGYGTFGDPSDVPYGYNEHGNLVPTSENGIKVSQPGGPGTFYVVCYHDASSNMNMILCNNSNTIPTNCRVWHYKPKYPGMATQGIPPTLAGNSGTWELAGIRTIDAGIPGPINPLVEGFGGYDHLTQGTGTTANAWKIEYISGGPLSILAGANMMRAWAGGSVIHTSDGRSTGQEFWFHQYTSPATWSLLTFCHSAGMAVQCISRDGYTATYTSDGPDQSIGFLGLASPKTENVYRINLLATGTKGELMAMYHQEEYREKFFTAPFVATGVHYEVIAPPIAYSGESFWITVLVILASGTTKEDYCGTSSFTSTDPLAKLEGANMDIYNYTWDSNDVGASCNAAGCPNGCDNGVKIFFNVTLFKLGLQSLLANDIMDGSITGITAINVVGADIKLWKEPKLGVQASGDLVTFRICWSNYSSASGLTFVITDAVPRGTTYVPQAASNHVCGTTRPIAYDFAYSTSASSSPPGTFATTTGTPTAGTYWLRWTVKSIDIESTGCACFMVRVN